MPLQYLFIFKFVDFISINTNGCHLIIAGRRDFRTEKHNWKDTFLYIALFFTSVMLIVAEQIYLNKL